MNNNKFCLMASSLSCVEAGFPSPADDFLESGLDLNDYLVRNPVATFMLRVSGDSMMGAGIYAQDILVVDRSLRAHHNQIVVAAVDGEMTVKRLMRDGNGWLLFAENRCYPSIQINAGNELLIWGVVVAVVRRLEGV